MPKTRPAYPVEFRRQMVDLVRAGRDPTDLAREFEPSGQTIRNWVAEVDRSEGRREEKLPGADPSLTTAERDELIRLRRENRQLKLERDPKGAPSSVKSSLARRPGSRGRPGSCRRDLPVHEHQPGRLTHRRHGPCARRVEGRVLYPSPRSPTPPDRPQKRGNPRRRSSGSVTRARRGTRARQSSRH